MRNVLWRSTCLLRLLTLVLSLGAGLASRSAEAGGSLDDAKRWFQEGDEAETAGDCTTAIQKFKLALEVKETPQLYLRIGRCQDKLGALVDALATFQKARGLSEGNDKVGEVIDEMIAALKPRVPKVTLTVKAPAPEGLGIKVNGAAVSAAGGNQLVNPGEVAITAQAPGYQPFAMKVRLQAGDQRTIAIELVGSGPVKPPPPPPPPEHHMSGPHPVSYVLLGVGAVGIGVGIGLAVTGFNIQSELEDPKKFGCTLQSTGKYSCLRDPFDGNAATDQVKKSNTFETAGWVTLGIGGAAAVTGVVLAIVTRHEAPSDPPPVSFAPLVAPRAAGLIVSRPF